MTSKQDTKRAPKTVFAFFGLLPAVFVLSFSLARAQLAAKKIPRVGYIATVSASSIQDRYEVREGRHDLGYIECEDHCG